MGKINVLEKHLAELIAAGEVVERPSSVVKEMVENSIDAGAKNITVEIKNGGVKYIRVTDDGYGIEKDDVKNAFLRNATSKIKLEDDLNNIATLGFRGEALASISAVAKVELITRTKDQNIGIRYEIAGGEEISFSEYGCPQGTTFIVKDLFYNTPARMKFLKKDVSEANAVAKVLNMIALSHPEVGIKFIRDGRLDLNAPGDGKIQSAIYAVYGKNFVSSLIEVSYSLNGITVNGFINNPDSARPNRSMQHFFINGRYVKTRTAMVALEEAYKGAIMVQKFPSCVLYINVPFNAVDVNVHPAKVEVRFIDERPIFDAVYHGVKSSLMKNETSIVMQFKKDTISTDSEEKKRSDAKPIPQVKIEISPREKMYGMPIVKVSALAKDAEDEPEFFMPKSVSNFKNTVGPAKFAKEEKSFDDIKQDAVVDSAIINRNVTTDGSLNISVLEEVEIKSAEDPKKNVSAAAEDEASAVKLPECVEQTTMSGLNDGTDRLNVIGEAFKTYILVQKNDNELVLVDKHALHERMIYEKLKSQKSEDSAQILLDPVAITVSKEEYGIILSNGELFKEAGFDIEDFGTSTVVVRSSPIYLERSEIEQAVIEMADHIMQNKKDLISSHVEWLYQNIACRAAIKAGVSAKMEEMEDLIRKIHGERHCPHGRPTSITITKKDIEKQFGRIQ